MSNANGLKVSRESGFLTPFWSRSSRLICLFAFPFIATATDDPSRIVTIPASDGKSGEEKIISYTNCKVVGNGSFGVVFAARMFGAYLRAFGSDANDSLLMTRC